MTSRSRWIALEGRAIDRDAVPVADRLLLDPSDQRRPEVGFVSLEAETRERMGCSSAATPAVLREIAGNPQSHATAEACSKTTPARLRHAMRNVSAMSRSATSQLPVMRKQRL